MQFHCQPYISENSRFFATVNRNDTLGAGKPTNIRFIYL